MRSFHQRVDFITEIWFRFGSFATDTAAPTSDIDFVVYGCKDIWKLEKELEEIDTLRKIDIFEYDSLTNEFLLEDIKKYGKQIYSLKDTAEKYYK